MLTSWCAAESSQIEARHIGAEADTSARSDYVKRGGELGLTNAGQLELLRSVVERGHALRMPVRGFSMTPLIRDGDILTIFPLDDDGPALGEVVAVVVPNTGLLAVHRVVAKESGGWRVRGDMSARADGVLMRDAMIGRVVRVERGKRDVRFGLGRERALLAALNRVGALMEARKLVRLPRRAAGFAARQMQSLSRYRLIVKRVARAVDIVEANDADLAAVYARLNPLGFRPELRDPDVTDLVARRGTRVLGFVQLVRHPEAHFPWVEHWLFSLVVWTQHRGAGIGEALTRNVIERARAQGAAELLLVVDEANAPAISLYRKLGFADVAMESLEPMLAPERKELRRRRIVMRFAISPGNATDGG